MVNRASSDFDVAGKPPGWHTAFYYLAEHLRVLSCGAINHKLLYSFVGTDGRYINHDNPLVRKRTAGALSHIIHSKQYAEHMRDRFSQNSFAFKNASREIQQVLLESTGKANKELVRYLADECWPDVAVGLRNERYEFRTSLDLVRIREEMRALFVRARREVCESEEQSSEVFLVVLDSILHVIAFGRLDSQFSRSLFEETPLVLEEELRDTSTETKDDAAGSEEEECEGLAEELRFACIARFADSEFNSLLNWWSVSPRHPFTIGRYTDCDAIDTTTSISRVHCCIYCKDGVWYFEDMSSLSGCKVVDKKGRLLFETEGGRQSTITQIEFGDRFILAGASYYWFGSLRYRDLRKLVVEDS